MGHFLSEMQGELSPTEQRRVAKKARLSKQLENVSLCDLTVADLRDIWVFLGCPAKYAGDFEREKAQERLEKRLAQIANKKKAH